MSETFTLYKIYTHLFVIKSNVFALNIVVSICIFLSKWFLPIIRRFVAMQLQIIIN